MPLEIERKWLARPPDLPLPAGKRLLQGYLGDGSGGEVRLRRAGQTHWITAKRGRGLVRAEAEVELTSRQFTALWPLTAGRRIAKSRHALQWREWIIELDAYHGELAGLWTAEVEFADTEEARRFEAPAWFGPELTGLPGWSNGDLARHGRPDRRPDTRHSDSDSDSD